MHQKKSHFQSIVNIVVFVTKAVWILVCLAGTQEATKGGFEVSIKIVVAWPISEKKEANVLLEQ